MLTWIGQHRKSLLLNLPGNLPGGFPGLPACPEAFPAASREGLRQGLREGFRKCFLDSERLRLEVGAVWLKPHVLQAGNDKRIELANLVLQAVEVD